MKLWAMESGMFWKLEKGKATDYPLKSPKGARPTDTLTWTYGRPALDFWSPELEGHKSILF